jgi:hypothetical protein
MPYPQLQSLETLHQAEQGYYGGITAVDKEFARLLNALEESTMAQDTIRVASIDEIISVRRPMQQSVVTDCQWRPQCERLILPGKLACGASQRSIVANRPFTH